MLDDVRREAIVRRLDASGEVTVSGLARDLGCAPETIRRDLARLEKAARLRRVHGGAVRIAGPELPPVSRRIVRASRVKDAIAAAAKPLVPAGGLVFLGPGSTTLALAPHLLDLPARTTFVTNMLDAAQVLAHGGRHKVYFLGGEVNGDTRATTGTEPVVAVARWLFDVAVVGAAALDAARGLLCPTGVGASMLEALRTASRRRVVLADATKFGAPGRRVLWPWADIDDLITERQLPSAFDRAARSAGTRVTVASV
jgi:DeoR/GlpR family transcriptional regulator of sugar metabolism